MNGFARNDDCQVRTFCPRLFNLVECSFCVTVFVVRLHLSDFCAVDSLPVSACAVTCIVILHHVSRKIEPELVRTFHTRRLLLLC